MAEGQRDKGAERQSDKGNDKSRVRTYRDLIVWQKAMALVTETYKTTKGFPREETYGLVSQMRRCAISIPSNIAEGFGRRTSQDYVRFLQIALGSLFELQTQGEIALNLSYLPQGGFERLHDAGREIERMLSSLMRKIEGKKK